MIMTDVANPSSKLLLGDARRGFVGIIQGFEIVEGRSSLSADELESQLIEMGFVEGARVEILHEGAIGRDPIAVRVSGLTVALRRREAQAVVVAPLASVQTAEQPPIRDRAAAQPVTAQ